MDDEQKPDVFGRNTCHICGGTEFVWGHHIDSNGSNVYFRPDHAGWGGGRKIRARMCSQCGNLQEFVLLQDKSK